MKRLLKNMKPLFSIGGMIISGLIVLTISGKFIPLYIEFIDIYNRVGTLGAIGSKTAILLAFWGIIAFVLSLVFQICNKSFIDRIFGNN